MSGAGENAGGAPGDAVRIVVIGFGNPCRGDDAVGVEFSRRFRKTAPAGVRVTALGPDPTALMSVWAGAGAAFLVDAVAPGRAGEAGHVVRYEAHDRPLPARLFGVSTHATGLAESVELARTLEGVPPVLVVYGIVGERFDAGAVLSPAVDAACEGVVRRVLEDIESLREG